MMCHNEILHSIYVAFVKHLTFVSLYSVIKLMRKLRVLTFELVLAGFLLSF